MNRLYWATQEYPTEYVLWDESQPYQGGYAALDHACRQNPGRGVYTGVVQIENSWGDLPDDKAGYCKVRIGMLPGTYYQPVEKLISQGIMVHRRSNCVEEEAV